MTNSYQPGFDSNYGTGATSLPLQGASRQAPMSGKPNDYLVLSVLSCIFGFFPLALAAILKCRWFFGRVFSFPLVEEFV